MLCVGRADQVRDPAALPTDCGSGRQQLCCILGGAWRLPIVAVYDMATYRADFIQILGGLRALGRPLEAQRVRAAYSRRDDPVLRPFVCTLGYGPVHLEAVHREALEVSDGGKLGSEFGHCSRHPKTLG